MRYRTMRWSSSFESKSEASRRQAVDGLGHLKFLTSERVRGLPTMWKQVRDACRRLFLYAGEDVGEVRDRIDAVFFAGRDESVEDRQVVARLLVADKEEVGAPESHPAQTGLSHVVVRRDGRVAEKSAELAEVAKQVANGSSHARAGLEAASMPAAPGEQLRKKAAASGAS